MFKKLLWKSNQHPKAKLPCVAIQLRQYPRHHLSLHILSIHSMIARRTIVKAYVWFQFLTCTKTLFFTDQSLLLRAPKLQRIQWWPNKVSGIGVSVPLHHPGLVQVLGGTLYFLSEKRKRLLANRWWLGRVGIFALPVCSFLELPKEAPHSIATGHAHTTRWKTGFPPALSIFTLCQQQL